MTTRRGLEPRTALEQVVLVAGQGGDDGPILMTVEQAAALLAVPVSWLKQRVSAQAVACTRLGRHVRFTRQQVATIVAANEQPFALTPLTGLTSRARRPA